MGAVREATAPSHHSAVPYLGLKDGHDQRYCVFRGQGAPDSTGRVSKFREQFHLSGLKRECEIFWIFGRFRGQEDGVVLAGGYATDEKLKLIASLILDLVKAGGVMTVEAHDELARLAVICEQG